MNKTTAHAGSTDLRLQTLLQRNTLPLLMFALLALAGYGFELFNLNLTIDEEVHAFASQADRWVEQGRWGMYLLNRFVLPQPVIPFVPLATALAFHVAALLLLLESWGVDSTLNKILIGGIGLACPIMAYMYTFATINFGIGAGLFCVALAQYQYATADGGRKLAAALPAALALAIYQGFSVALAAAFLTHIVASAIRSGRRTLEFRAILDAAVIGVLAIVIYYVTQKLFQHFTGLTIGYVDTFFDFEYLQNNFLAVKDRVLQTMQLVYCGDALVYGSDVPMLPVVLTLALAAVALRIGFCNLSIVNKLVVVALVAALLMLPFVTGFLMRGMIAMRFLVALPIVFAGILMLALETRSPALKLPWSIAVASCLFQFAISTNTLFSASHLALQADRLLAPLLIARIEDARQQAGGGVVKHLEVVGFIDRPATRLIPKSETFGASFFEWDQGNPNRIVLFLQTLGYPLQILPAAERSKLMDQASDMSVWPDKNSVKVVGDTAIVKFGQYSYVQTRNICQAEKNPKYCE